MNLGPAVVARLRDDAAVAAIVDDRIHWLVRPQATELPAIVLQVITEDRPQHLKAFEDMRTARVQVACQAEQYSTSRELADAAVAALIDVADVEDEDGALLFWRADVDGPRDLGNQEETRFVHRAVVDMILRYGTAA